MHTHTHTHTQNLQQGMHERVWNITLYADSLSCYVPANSCLLLQFATLQCHNRAGDQTVGIYNRLPAKHMSDPHRFIHHSPLDLQLFVLQYTSGGSLQLCLIDYSQTKNYSWSISHLTPTRASELNNDRAQTHNLNLTADSLYSDLRLLSFEPSRT